MQVDTFLSQAVAIELAAERAYAELAGMMTLRGNIEAAAFFHEMQGFARLHKKSIMARAGMDPAEPPPERDFPQPLSLLEIPVLRAMDAAPDIQHAMELALEAERRGVAFYQSVAEQGDDEAVRRFAASFVDEELSHVAALERFLGQRPY